MRHGKIPLFLLLAAPFFFAAPAFAATTNPALSANWAGYVADTASAYSSVVGSWDVPVPATASQSSSLATDATWVGIGGVKSSDLIQAGTQAVVQNNGTTYEAWYETLPAGQQAVPLAVHGGDSVTVSLIETSANHWHLSFLDNTTGKDYEKDIAYSSSQSSAEWIEEMPVLEAGRATTYLPLDNFGTVTFTGGYTVADGTQQTIASSGAQSLTMAGARGTGALATPTVLADDSTFSINRSAAATPSTVEAAGQVTAAQTPSGPHSRRGHRIIIVFSR